ncbi:MAG: cyclic nucleotide-binding domain-containing protein [Spirochaetae bacterium HGW-Spirochaetae-1]|jgi:CRP-like cAMP-binding protein|nr:MAG: cyclic nucleotide-binding domain-containing protein [Spirochaetae bacterium HGW-Spirochaetae-1]
MSARTTATDESILDKLKQVDIFGMFCHDEEAMKKILAICTMRSYRKGKSIIKEGEYGDELYIVLDGEIDILKKTLQNEKYTVTTLDSSMGGIYVGEMALIDNDKRSASVIARSECHCLVINRKNFIKFGDANPAMGLAITRAIARQISLWLRKSNADVITLFSALVDEIAAES